MVKRLINFRLENNEYERLKLLKEYYAYPTISSMIRDRLLRHDISTQKLLSDIHKKLFGKDIKIHPK